MTAQRRPRSDLFRRPFRRLSRKSLSRRRKHIRLIAIARFWHQWNCRELVLIMLFLTVKQTREDNHPQRDQHNRPD
jgi:hypothetical protein